MQAMGYNSDEESDVLMTYWFSNAPKSTHDALKDDDDYQGIITALQAHCANSAPLTVKIHDANVFIIFLRCHKSSCDFTEE